MTILANASGSHWLVLLVLVSATGSLVACRSWLSRFFFFLLAPVIYLLLWIPITVLAGFFFWNGDWAIAVGTILTFGLYAFNCLIFHNDGVGGVALMDGPAGARPRGRKPGGGGDGGTTPPSPITYRRMSLK